MNKFSALYLKRLLTLGLAASVVAVLLAPAAANATPYVVRFTQQGSSVVAKGSGAFDLTGLQQDGVLGGGSPPIVWASLAFFQTGPSGFSDLYDGGAEFSGPDSYGSGGGFSGSSTSGDFVSLAGSNVPYGNPALIVPHGYISFTELSSTATWDSATFASLGLTPGSYVWTWGTGAEQRFTLDIGDAASVPEPAALGMFGFGVLLIGAFAGLRRRTP